MSETRIPPYDEEAEISVLASAINDEEGCNDVVNMLDNTDFYKHIHRLIFECIQAIKQKNHPVDLITLHAKLIDKGLLEQVGGIKFLGEITSNYSTSANTKYYIKILKEKSFRRKCIQNAIDIQKNAYSGEYEKLLGSLENKIPEITEDSSATKLTDIISDALASIHVHQNSGKRFTGLETGFKDLDYMTGGLQKTDFIVIAGRPSMGKTALALNLISNSAKFLKSENKISVFFSIEMSKEKIAIRQFSSALKLSSEKFRTGDLTEDDWFLMENKSDEFEKDFDNIYIIDDASISLQDIRTNLYGLKSNTRKDVGLIVIDYLQIINTVDTGNRNNDISKISRNLKMIAKEFNCPLIALSQLSRAVEQRDIKTPMLSDLRESGAIEQDADVVCFLYRDEYYNPSTDKKNQADIILAKHRDGATGTVTLNYISKYVAFENIR